MHLALIATLSPFRFDNFSTMFEKAYYFITSLAPPCIVRTGCLFLCESIDRADASTNAFLLGPSLEQFIHQRCIISITVSIFKVSSTFKSETFKASRGSFAQFRTHSSVLFCDSCKDSALDFDRFGWTFRSTNIPTITTLGGTSAAESD